MTDNILEKYRIDNSLTYEALGLRLGYTKLRVYRWCKNVSEPRKAERINIESKTGGAVSFSGFYTQPHNPIIPSSDHQEGLQKIPHTETPLQNPTQSQEQQT